MIFGPRKIDIFNIFKICVSQCLLSTRPQPSYLDLGKVSPHSEGAPNVSLIWGGGFRMRPKVYTQDTVLPKKLHFKRA